MPGDRPAGHETAATFARLTEACDALLSASDADPAWLACPYLHVISGHPALLDRYDSALTGSAARPWRTLLPVELAAHLSWMLKSIGAATKAPRQAVDILLVGGLVDAAHLESDADFYFGTMQRMLADRGISSLLLLRNQTAVPVASLRGRARREGTASRRMLEPTLGFAEEVALTRIAFRAGAALRRRRAAGETPLQSRVRVAAARSARSTSTVSNLRLERQVEAICRAVTPRLVITMYEGHAWERCVYRAARRANPAVLCAGYQHTIIRASAHAMLRPLDHLNPDVLLCLGEVTRDALVERARAGASSVLVYGTHRRQEPDADPAEPASRPACLVLPEGMADETRLLFTFAIASAELLPGTLFLLRSHPLLPLRPFIASMLGTRPLPPNVELSDARPFDADLARAGSLLYRGSSTVLYGILAGLKPYYVAREGELTLDPLYRLREWRETVASPPEFASRMQADSTADAATRRAAWSRARDFARRYALPEQPEAVDALVTLMRERR